MASKNCQHQIRSYCKQAKLLDEEVMEQFNDFYVDSSKQRQDQFILNSIVLMPIKRRRVSDHEHKRNLQYNIHYFVSISLLFSVDVKIVSKK